MIPADAHPVRVGPGPGGGGGQVGGRVQPPVACPQEHLVVRIGAVHRMPQDAEEARLGQQLPNSRRRLRAFEVDG